MLYHSCGIALHRRHNERNGVSNHRHVDCFLGNLLWRRSEKTANSASLAFVRGIQRWPVNFPHKGPVTWKCFHLMASSWICKSVSFDISFVTSLDNCWSSIALPVTWEIMALIYPNGPRPDVRPAGGPNSFHWKNVKVAVLSCCTKFHEPHVVLEYAHF